MLKNVAAAVVVALTAGAVGTATLSEAYPLPAPQGVQLAAPSAIDLAAMKRKVIVKRHGHRWVYSKKYGPRYRYRHGRYTYHYGGWWYPRPWWGVGVAVGPYVSGYHGCKKVVRYYKHRKVVRRVCG